MSSLQEDIDKLRAEGSKATAEADRLTQLLATYPDLKKYVGRWNKVVYYSPSFNTQATQYDMRHNCGCCSDSPLEIWTYAETAYGRVYSDPPMWVVGERHYMGGDVSNDGWQKRLKDAGIPEVVIDSVDAHFRRDRAERIRAAEEDGGFYLEEDELKF